MSRRVLVWFWSGGGGGSQFAARLAQRLGKQFGADNVALSLRADDPTVESARARGVNVKLADIVSDRQRPMASVGSLPKGAVTIADHARAADIIVAAMNFAALAPLSLTLAKPLVYCAHDPAPHPGDYAASAQRATQALILHRARAVVALSQFAGDVLARNTTVARKLHVAPLSSVFEPAPAAPREAGPVRLLLAGRMIAYKGLDLIANALDFIADRNDWRLTIAGHGPALTDDARARFRHPQIDSIRAEWLSEAALDALMADCDILLAPYIEASQSGAVAEALARGKPCVVTPVGALAEQIGHGRGGWIAEKATAEAYAHALAAALAVPVARVNKSQGALAIAQEAWEADHWGWLSQL